MLFYLLGYAITRLFIKHTKASGLKLRRRWVRQAAIPILNIDIEVTGKAHDQPALYVSNHRSFVDPLILSKYVDAFVIAKAEIAGYPLINKGAEVTGIIWVARGDADSRNNARKAFVDVVKNGNNILVYPEGTISTKQGTLPFKKGTFHEAAKEGIPIVPVAIEYKSPKDLWTISNIIWQYLRSFGKWKTKAKLVIGPVMEGTDGRVLAEECHQWINDQMTDMQTDWTDVDYSRVDVDYE